MTERAESPLRAALIEAATELERNYSWRFGEDNGEITEGDPPSPEFLEVFEHHLSLVNPEWREHRIAALRAELALLEVGQ